MKLLTKFLSIYLLFTVTIGLLTNPVYANGPVNYGDELKNIPNPNIEVNFSDLSKNHWAYNYVIDLVARGVFSGYPDGKFRPNNMISRAEFATIVVKAAGLSPKKMNSSSFTDVNPTDWFSPYIETAKDYLTGYQTSNGSYVYNPNAPALREDIAVSIVKIKGYDQANKLPNHSVIQAMFKDYNGISAYSKNYVALAVEYGLMSGYPDETFRPQNPITRVEAAALLWRAFQYGNDNKGNPGQPSIPNTTDSPNMIPMDTNLPVPINESNM